MTLPASAPISLANVATELRAGSMWLNHDDVKRLLGISRLSGGPISLAQCLGKTRPWWGLVPVDQDNVGATTYYGWITSDGGLAEAVDPYFGNVAITGLQATLNAGGSNTVLNFASDPGFRNDIKGQLLDDNWGVLREVVFSYHSSTGNWWTPVTTGTDYSTCLFLSAGYMNVNLIKL
ncbi:hypothetical protein D9M68_123190 [compost metagenome]